ncbi:1513_t:CDS:2 [Cetraspora pellucida]|uniref:1513_t:CDS:1 n=1 Tax=Cetraspora pellucida TaxID=1433469 RepID=A0A9N9INK1_9GLOM|nr:1513_t:CDS:2 [Cetraspora pellucida]
MSNESNDILSGANPTKVDDELAFVQIVITISVTAAIHAVLQHIRQPQVVCGAICGVILGVSVVGHVPGYMDTMFPKDSLVCLKPLTHLIGILNSFIVGANLKPKILSDNMKFIIPISICGTILPFTLGLGIAYIMYDTMNNYNVVDSDGFSHDVPFLNFVLVVCPSITITAFPTLWRVLYDLGLTDVDVGARALTAAFGDHIVGGIEWGLAILSSIVAIVGKTFGCIIGAKLIGIPFNDASIIGSFMNYKGALELIILNIGFEKNIINENVFTILYIMILVVMSVTTPLATYLYLKKMVGYRLLGVKEIDQPDSDVKSAVVHTIELEQRTSIGMKFLDHPDDRPDQRMDMRIFPTFSQNNSININAIHVNTALVNYCKKNTDVILVIISWRDQSAKFVQYTFKFIPIYASVGVFIDHGLISAIDSTGPSRVFRVFVPFFGSADDREAVTFALRLLHDDPNVSLTVLRIIKSETPTENDVPEVQPDQNEIVITDEPIERPLHDRSMPTIDSKYVVSQEYIDDELIWNKLRLLKEQEPRLKCPEKRYSFTPIQYAIKEINNHFREGKDLVILGHNSHPTVNEPGTHRSLGYVAEEFLAGEITPSLLVLKAKQIEQ